MKGAKLSRHKRQTAAQSERVIRLYMHEVPQSMEKVRKEFRVPADRLFFTKGRWRGQQRSKRLKLLERGSTELVLDAPVGHYRVDKIALEFLDSNKALTDIDRGNVVGRLRKRVTIAGEGAVTLARWCSTWLPDARQKTKRFYKDIRDIQLLIERHKDLKPIEINFSSEITSVDYRGDMLERLTSLQNSLSDASTQIKSYLTMYKLTDTGGNYDLLTRYFIVDLLEIWRGVLGRKPTQNEYARFGKFVWFAWQDLRLPDNSADGRSLRDWLVDRVRKQFPKGLPESQKAMEAAWDTIELR